MKRLDWNEQWTLNGKQITLPYDAMLSEQREPGNPSGTAGAYFPGGVYVYEKKFLAEPSPVSILEFEGIYRDTEVKLNDKTIYQNQLGTVGFYVDLSKELLPGENKLTVIAKNDQIPNARWYTGSGIYRPVSLWTSEKTHIAVEGIRISSPECAEDVSKVIVETPLIHSYSEIAYVRLETELINQEGAVICRESTPVTLFPGENPVIAQRLYPRNVKLWNVWQPYLYTVRVALTDEKPIKTMEAYMSHKNGTAGEHHMLDMAEAQFGIRHIQADPVHGLRINGKKVLLRGACIHADLGILGAASEADSEKWRIQRLKEAGFNAVRIAHQPASKALLEACDQAGMLPMEETFDMWDVKKTEFDDAAAFDQHWKAVIEYTVMKDYNHPCVVLYSIGNEITNLHTDTGAHISRLLSDCFRKLDDSRLVTNAVNGGMASGNDGIAMMLDMGLLGQEEIARVTGKPDGTIQDFIAVIQKAIQSGDINDLMTLLSGKMNQQTAHPLIAGRLEEPFSHLDVCGYNYMLPAYEIDTKKNPNRIIFGSETNPPRIPQLWKYAESDPANLGDFTWTGWDYLGETGVGITNYQGKMTFSTPYPALLAYCGDIDLTGYRRPLSYLREITFGLRKNPYISVQLPQYYGADAKNTPWAVTETVRSWTWNGFENKPVHIEIYSPGDSVVLLQDGKEIGRAALENHRVGFETVYMPGKLEAVAYQGEQEIGRDCLSTAGPATQLFIHGWSGKKLTFIEIQVVDQQGLPVMDGEHLVHAETDGCVLEGFGSGDPMSIESFREKQHSTYRGRALLAVRGHGTVTISADGLKQCSISC